MVAGKEPEIKHVPDASPEHHVAEDHHKLRVQQVAKETPWSRHGVLATDSHR